MIILENTITLPDQFFWYTVASLIGVALFYITKWWIGRVESRQDLSDNKFNVFIQEMQEMRNTQSLQNQVLEQHGKYIENSEGDIKQLSLAMIEALKHLQNGSHKNKE